jgi:hypothetical protein
LRATWQSAKKVGVGVEPAINFFQTWSHLDNNQLNKVCNHWDLNPAAAKLRLGLQTQTKKMTFPKDGNHWELNPGSATLRLRLQTQTKNKNLKSFCSDARS